MFLLQNIYYKFNICYYYYINFQRCLKDRIATLETQLAEERQKCKVAEKRAEMLNGGASGMDDEGGLQVSQSEDAAYKEREKELLRFEVRVLSCLII